VKAFVTATEHNHVHREYLDGGVVGGVVEGVVHFAMSRRRSAVVVAPSLRQG
jgi:hypothetical protein